MRLKFKEYLNYLSFYFPMNCIKHIKRNNTLWLFGAWMGHKFSDNSKALFLYLLNNAKGKKIYWIAKDNKTYEELKRLEYPVLKSNSIKGIYYQIKAGVVFYCTGEGDLNSRLISGATHFNLWHGVGGGKKIGFDAGWYDSPYDKACFRLRRKIYNKTYFVCTSEEMKMVFKSAFRLKDNQFIMAGQPRNDMFFDQDYRISSFDTSLFSGKRVILYLPTHRLEGNMKINCSELFDLEQLNMFCERNNCIFLIKKHFYHKNENEDLKSFSNIMDWTQLPNIDTNELLMIADYLISDYSSVTADYLLLNRPIFYYCFDLNRYLEMDRDMYWSYDEITPGRKSKTFDDLLQSMKRVIVDGIDDYSDERERVLSMFYGKQARKMVCHDIVNAVQTIVDD